MKHYTKPCPKTMSGKHMWVGGDLVPQHDAGHSGITLIIPEYTTDILCRACKIIDDRKKK